MSRRIALSPRVLRRKPAYVPQVFVPPVPAEAIRRLVAHNSLDARLAATDRWFWRWAASHGSCLPTDEVPTARFPPLAPTDAIQTDDIIAEAPYRWDSFVHSWYRSDKSPEQIGAQIGMGRTAVYAEHKIVLGYFLGQFRAYNIDIPNYPGL